MTEPMKRLDFKKAVAHCAPTPVQAFDGEVERIRQDSVVGEVHAAAERSGDPEGYMESLRHQAERAS